MEWWFIGLLLGGILLGGGIGYSIVRYTVRRKLQEAEERAQSILRNAEKEAETMKKEKLLEVKDEWYRKKQEFDQIMQERSEKLRQYEQKIKDREEKIAQKLELLTTKERQLQAIESALQQRQKEIDARFEEVEQLRQEQIHRLERITGMSREDAKKYLLESLLNEAKAEAALKIKEIRDQAKEEAKRQAQKIVVEAIQRVAADYAIENTVAVVNLPNDEMKGRIIGREGRNIRAFEAATGVDLIIDDTPEAVLISCFDPLRREIAKRALEKLVSDGRIHPTRIEEVVQKAQREVEEEIMQIGKQTLLELDIHNVHREIVRLVGRMRYRFSYGQNLLQHSIEVARLAAIMAAELGLDVRLAKRAGLLHDIGKCVEQEGPHALIGFEIAKRYREHPLVANAIGAHHDEMEMESPIAAIVQAADAISGARPGARREALENYVKRLSALEEIASSFDGVLQSYAIQAGREIRVIVQPEKVDDLTADVIANEIAKKIESTLDYPGQIKVTVVREKRSVAYAK